MSTQEQAIFDEHYDNNAIDLDKCLKMAVVGKVSTGKSSLINALMERKKDDPIVAVGAKSGVTTQVKRIQLDNNVVLFDSPGLGDVETKNSDVTKELLTDLDVGILVVSGSLDESQRENYLALKDSAAKVFVVLNKVDEWDELEQSELDAVVAQWKEHLGVEEMYQTCTKGYDPKYKIGLPMDLRGVDALRDDLWRFLKQQGKDLLLARHLGDKRKYAAAIISSALLAVGGEALLPGSAAYITATQVVAITSLHYLYTGQVLSKTNAMAMLPSFIGESVGVSAFLFIKSFLPPTGVVDIAAAGVAISITFAMLATINYILSEGLALDDKNQLKHKFNDFKNATPKDVIDKIINAIKSGQSPKDVVFKILFD